jgi:hypothetical protein
MNLKQIGGAVIAAAGVILIALAVHARNQVSEAKDLSDKATNFFTHNPSVWNPLIKFFGGSAQKALIGKYTGPILFALIAGICLTGLGLWIVFVYRKRQS